MEALSQLITAVNGIVWGPPMLLLILGTGLYLNLRLRFMPVRNIVRGFRMIWQGRKAGPSDTGEVSPFTALMTCLAATVGTGNIAGVATAVAIGGPGAVFWMWCTALVGMATKYAEVLLAVKYRERDANGEFVGGPMYVIKNALGPRWRWLGGAFALFGGLAAFGIGNMVQANGVAEVLQSSFGVDKTVSGVVLMVLTGLVILGGIKRIGAVADKLVPLMCISYVGGALFGLVVFADRIPQAFGLIFAHAFTPVAAGGGFAGAAVWAAMRYGVARGIFSNEAGLGTAGIAQAAGTTSDPVRSGLIGMMGTFIDTLIVCSMTGLLIVASGVWTGGESGATLTSLAFQAAMGDFGKYLLAAELAIFSYTTLLGWSYYGERCWGYLVGTRCEVPYRVLWTLLVLVGAVAQLDFIWLVSDTMNAFMAIPNLIALLVLAPVVVKLTGNYFDRLPHAQGGVPARTEAQAQGG